MIIAWKDQVNLHSNHNKLIYLVPNLEMRKYILNLEIRKPICVN